MKRPDLSKRNMTHGLSQGHDGKKIRLYNIWVRMKQRCFDVNSSDYERYGGRGISVCKKWLNFKPFYEWSMASGYRDDLTIERINNAGNYEPNNCKWVPPDAQARNKRNNRFIVFRGERKTLAEWCEILGMEHSLLRYRLDKWGIEKAFTTPIRRCKKVEINPTGAKKLQRV